MPLPPFTASGDLLPGVHRATLSEVLERFGSGSPQRKRIGWRLERIYNVARATGHLARCVVFGRRLTGEARLLFDHAAAQPHCGGSVFWLRRLAVLDNEHTTIAHWQITRDRSYRGIVEILPESV